MNLLIADDDRESAETLAELLAFYIRPVQVVLAFDGLEMLAAATAAGSRHHAIITDIEMPRMDGITAAIRVRRALGAATPVLIAVTGNPGLSKRSAINPAFDHTLVKPVELDELVRLLRTLDLTSA